MARFKVFIEYAGTKYSGWQIQKNARTVQGELTRVVARRHRTESVRDVRIGPDRRRRARARTGRAPRHHHRHPRAKRCGGGSTTRCRATSIFSSIELAQRKFHARHDAVSRSYLYQISRRRTAFAKNFVWWVRDDLDLAKMRATAEQFSGMKDFRSFTDDSAEEKSTVVGIERIEIAEDGDLVLVRVEGSHFLWKMVRRMVGVMVDVGVGGTTVEQAARFLREDSGIPAKLTAPASGLFLERVYYRGETRRPALRGCVEREISTVNAMTERLVTCPSCGTKNRLPPPQPDAKRCAASARRRYPRRAGPIEVTDSDVLRQRSSAARRRCCSTCGPNGAARATCWRRRSISSRPSWPAA